MRSWQRMLLGGLVVAAIAAAGIALNFALLGLAQNDNDRAGKLSPRAVFDGGATGTGTSPGTTTTPTTTGDSRGHGDDRKHDGDDD